MGVAQNLSGGVTQVLAFVSTYQGPILEFLCFEPQPYSVSECGYLFALHFLTNAVGIRRPPNISEVLLSSEPIDFPHCATPTPRASLIPQVLNKSSAAFFPLAFLGGFRNGFSAFAKPEKWSGSIESALETPRIGSLTMHVELDYLGRPGLWPVFKARSPSSVLLPTFLGRAP